MWLCLAVEKYGWLVDGTADERIRTFIDEEHTFDEYTEVFVMCSLLAKWTCFTPAYIQALGCYWNLSFSHPQIQWFISIKELNFHLETPISITVLYVAWLVLCLNSVKRYISCPEFLKLDIKIFSLGAFAIGITCCNWITHISTLLAQQYLSNFDVYSSQFWGNDVQMSHFHISVVVRISWTSFVRLAFFLVETWQYYSAIAHFSTYGYVLRYTLSTPKPDIYYT